MSSNCFASVYHWQLVQPEKPCSATAATAAAAVRINYLLKAH